MSHKRNTNHHDFDQDVNMNPTADPNHEHEHEHDDLLHGQQEAKDHFLNDQLCQLREKLSINVLSQYSKYPYYLYSALVVQRYVKHLTSLLPTSSSSLLICQLSPLRNIGQITDICLKYHYQHSCALHQIAFIIWQTRGGSNHDHVHHHDHHDSLYVTDNSDVFTGARLAAHIEHHLLSNHHFTFRREQIASICRDLLKYKYLQRIAQSSSSNHEYELDDTSSSPPSPPRQQHMKATANMHSGQHAQHKKEQYELAMYGYYRFHPVRHREFVKLSQPDRDAWSRGSKVQVYSHSLGGWQNATVLQINRNLLTVAYAASTSSRPDEQHYNGSMHVSIRKVIHRYDDDKIQSTDSFMTDRLKLDLHSQLLVYSHAHRLWCQGQIVEVIGNDDHDEHDGHIGANDNDNDCRIFKVSYTVDIDMEQYSVPVVKAKYVHVWSSQIRLESEVDAEFERTDDAESPYKKGSKVRVWSKSEQKWIDGVIEQNLPGFGLINVRYGHSEKLLEINSPHFRLPADVLQKTMLD